MNIGMILDNQFDGDMRVMNEVISLQKAGFNVFVLCFNHGDKKNIENYSGAKIIRLNLSITLKNKMKGLTNISSLFDPYKIYWSNKIVRFVKKYKINVLHAHDLYLLGPVFKANKKLNKKIPVVGDLHENFPAALKSYKYTNTFPGKYIISIPRWEKTEIKWVKRSNYIITVIEEARDRYINIGCNSKKIHVVQNYVNPEVFSEKKIADNVSILKKFKNKFIITYMGTFDTHRGLKHPIKSLLILKKIIPNIQLVYIGKGPTENELKELTYSLGVNDLVSFEGFVSEKIFPAYYQASNVCIIPHLKTDHTDNTIPHKLFQYMLYKKPVIASNCNPIKRIVEDCNAGLIYTHNNENEFAEAILKLYKNPKLAQEMGINGKSAVKKKYNWESAANNLIKLYKKIDNEIKL